jgi:hypothetical protein
VHLLAVLHVGRILARATFTIPVRRAGNRADLGFDPGEPEPGPRPDTFPDFLPPGWSSGDDDRSFPWS